MTPKIWKGSFVRLPWKIFVWFALIPHRPDDVSHSTLNFWSVFPFQFLKMLRYLSPVGGSLEEASHFLLFVKYWRGSAPEHRRNYRNNNWSLVGRNSGRILGRFSEKRNISRKPDRLDVQYSWPGGHKPKLYYFDLLWSGFVVQLVVQQIHNKSE